MTKIAPLTPKKLTGVGKTSVNYILLNIFAQMCVFIPYKRQNAHSSLKLFQKGPQKNRIHIAFQKCARK